MTWLLKYSETAEKQLSKLDRGVARDVKKFMAEVCDLKDPAVRGHPLSGPLAGLHTYRIGQIRIIVQIERNIVRVSVVKIDRRDSAY